MVRSLGTVFATVVFATTLSGIADAKSRAVTPDETVAVASQPAAATVIAPPAEILAVGETGAAAPDFVVVSPDASEHVRAMDSAAAVPAANADYRMWSTAPAGKANPVIGRFARGIVNRTSSIAMNLTRSAMRFIGTPYVFGGTSPSGFDCSGYVQHVFAMVGIQLPRTADVQYYNGHATKGGIAVGDLVFFQTYLPGPSHVGIYLGHGKFVHSSSHGVRVSSLGESYWAARYLGAKRYALAK